MQDEHDTDSRNSEPEWLKDPELGELFSELERALDAVNTVFDEIDAIHRWAGELAHEHGGRVLGANRDFVEIAFDRYPVELQSMVENAGSTMDLFEAEQGFPDRLMIYLREP